MTAQDEPVTEPLKWSDAHGAQERSEAQSALGMEYQVWKHRDRDEWYFRVHMTLRSPTFSEAPLASAEMAKQAAQNDFEMRVRSALRVLTNAG